MEVQARVAARRAAAQIGREVEVLVEGRRGGGLVGRTRTQAPEIDGVITLAGHATPGEIARARVTGASTYDLNGELTQIEVDTAGSGA